MNTQLSLVVVIGIALALTSCAAPPAAPTPTTAPSPTLTATPLPTPTQPPHTPAEIVTAMAARFSAGDLEGGMAYWADNAIWYMFGLPPNGSDILRGKQAIHTEFTTELEDHLTWNVDVQSVVDNVVTTRDTTWLDFTRQIGVAPVQGTGQYLVEDGKISTYAWTIAPESLVKLKAALAAMAAEQPPAEPEATLEATAPASAPVSALTVTIADGVCSTEQPIVLKAGDVQLTVDVRDQNRDGYAVVFLTLDEGHDFMDLMAASTGYPPPWAHALHYKEIEPATSKTYEVTVSEGPLYGICFSKPPDHPIGNLGPFEVRP